VSEDVLGLCGVWIVDPEFMTLLPHYIYAEEREKRKSERERVREKRERDSRSHSGVLTTFQQ
jgi:hypothetical protein